MVEISSTGDQMLKVLEIVAKNGPVTMAEIVRISQMNRTVAQRLASTLEERSYLRRSQKGYVLGAAVSELARHLEKDISAVARPYMAKLAEQTGETVVLHCLDKDQAMVVEQAIGDKHLVRVQHTPGSRHPLYTGASGWALLSFQDEKSISRLLKRTHDPIAAQKRIENIRIQRYAISHDELQMGVHGVAAPLFDVAGDCVASIAILVPATRSEKLDQMLPQLLNIAAAISDELINSD